MLTKVIPLSTQLTLQEYLSQYKIKTDLLPAFEELGVEEPDDMIDIEPSNIEDIIKSKGLKQVEANRLRKCYQAIKKTDTSTAKGAEGWSPLALAHYGNHADIIQLLTNAGAK